MSARPAPGALTAAAERVTFDSLIWISACLALTLLVGIAALPIWVTLTVAACGGILVGSASFGDLSRQSNLPFLSGVVGGVIVAALGLLYGGAIGLTLYAAGDFISLLLALEENTRATANLLRGQPNPETPMAPR